MPARKPLFMSDDGFAQEMSPSSDTMTVSGLTVSGLLDMVNFRITNLADGINLTDAVTVNQLNNSLLDGLGRVKRDLVVNEPISKGDPVYWTNTSDQIGKAQAGTDSKSFAIGVAETDQFTIGLTSRIIVTGIALGVLTTLSPSVGQNIYLNTSGGLSLTPPTGNNRIIRIGIAANSNDLWVHIVDYGKKSI